MATGCHRLSKQRGENCSMRAFKQLYLQISGEQIARGQQGINQALT